MKTLSIAALALLAVSAQAQIKETWQNTFADPIQGSQTIDTAVTPNGNTLVLSQMADRDLRLARYDGFGNRMWSYRLVGADSFLNVGTDLACDSSGNAYLFYTLMNYTTKLVKVDEGGSLVWQQDGLNMAVATKMVIDAQDGIVLFGRSPSPTYSPVVTKVSASGLPQFQTELDWSGYAPGDLAVAGNGLIYVSARNVPTSTNVVASLTPNGTLKYQSSWVGTYIPSTVADRNGRFVATELKSSDPTKAKVFTFDAQGSQTMVEVPLVAAASELFATFDANGRLVLASEVATTSAHSLAVDYLAVTDTTVTPVARAEVRNAPWDHDLVGITADAFGQVYVSAKRTYLTTKQGLMFAFDEMHTLPLWTRADLNASSIWTSSRVCGSVGRWGQVAMATTVGTAATMESATGIRQMGLRNLLINGQSFTGGRTITGTVNFYSNSNVDRAVALNCNAPTFAVVNSSATVAAGASQTGMSIEIKPTSVRRAISIEGTFDGTKRKVVFYIEPPVAASLTVFPTSQQGGKNINATARLNGIAPAAGISATIGASSESVTIPSSVMIPSGQISKSFTIATYPVSQSESVSVSMTTGSVTKTASFTLVP